MIAIAVDAYPYFYGDRLNIPVSVNGQEVFEGEVDIRLMFQHFIECCFTYGIDASEVEMYDLLFALEEGIDMINEALGSND